MSSSAIPFARKVANALSWDFFVLDHERGAARILPKDKRYPIRRMDFSQLRGASIEADLRHRDFTINALGVGVQDPSSLIDPTGGLEDLRLRQLRACGPDSISQDAVRVLRAIRFASDLEFTIHPKTTAQIKNAVRLVQEISVERIRDELFRILDSKNVAAAVRLLDHLKVIEVIFPDIIHSNHSKNGDSVDHARWQVAFASVRKLSELLIVLQPQHDAEAAADAILGSVAFKLGRFREKIAELLGARITDERSVRSLLYFTILGIARFPTTPSESEAGHSTFDDLSKSAHNIQPLRYHAEQFRLSRSEGVYIDNASAAYELLEAVRKEQSLGDLDIYHYYQRFSEAGATAVLLYLSSAAARSVGPPDAELWAHRLKIARSLWEAYFERYEDVVSPHALLDGSDLMNEFGIESGPRVGELLQAIKEAQVVDQLSTREEAFEFAREQIRSSLGK
jgi:poly(A) polymerase